MGCTGCGGSTNEISIAPGVALFVTNQVGLVNSFQVAPLSGDVTILQSKKGSLFMSSERRATVTFQFWCA